MIACKTTALVFLFIAALITLWFCIDLYSDRLKRFRIVKANYRKTFDFSVSKDYRYAKMKLIDAVFNIIIVSLISGGLAVELYNSILLIIISK